MEENKKTGYSDEEILKLVEKIAGQLCEMVILLTAIIENMD